MWHGSYKVLRFSRSRDVNKYIQQFFVNVYLLFVKEYALPIKLIINLSTGQLVINSVVSITSLFVQIVCFLRTYST